MWKLIGALALITLLFISFPLAMYYLGIGIPLTGKSFIVLSAAVLGLLTKTIYGHMQSNEFQYYKFGHDFCFLTFNAALSSLALQLVASQDLFPGVPTTGVFGSMSVLTKDVIQQRELMLALVLIISNFFALFTAYIGRQIKLEKPKAPNLLSLISCIFGLTLFWAYMIMLVAKG